MTESKRAIADDADRPLHPDDIGWDPDDAPELEMRGSKRPTASSAIG
ncbi:hypothetical protein [uncultured Methylobacterium sp.]